MRIVLTALYLGAVVAANLLIAHFGPAAAPVVAFVFIGLNLATRDRLHDLWGPHVARNMLLLVAAGGALSYALNAGAGRVAVASMLAFAVSEAGDALLYHARRHRPYLERTNTSNLLGAALDSLIFPVVAFGGFPVGIIALQFIAKVAGGLLWSVVLRPRVHGPVPAPSA
ncbi:VUT family protein [Deinococcus ficus]|uniref:VUT family protein n=1 Tax=Deinococcus ficus TaxID=317577 RepID=UPI0004128747|nr:VUT family protein [Deinococcus ficus]